MSSGLRVTVAVLTFQRPRDLDLLLPALEQQALAQSSRYRVDVLVVDNDPSRSAESAVRTFAGRSSAVIRYAHEGRPNIAQARNRALELSADSRLLVFIDDDERPSSDWLALLLSQFERDRPAAVVGPVQSVFAVEPDEWIRAGGFFVRRRLATGTRIAVGATNNLLLDLAIVRQLELRFDPDFGLTGGEDMLFTRSLHGHGQTISWCDEALVTDVVPLERVTRRWVTLRAFSNGNSWGLTSVRLASTRHGRMLARGRLVGQGGVRVLAGGARVVLGLALRRPTDHARGTRAFMRGLGMLGGAVGFRYLEYRRSEDVSASR